MNRIVAVFCSLLVSLGCSLQIDNDELERLVGQKLMLDFRYFCADGTPSEECKSAVTELPPELAEVLRDGQIGGVILFADNLIEAPQIVRLIDAMQKVMRDAGLPPLFIAIDQEGGRVARLPEQVDVRFAGNMALGASYAADAEQGQQLTLDVASGMAQVLHDLGFNLNFAPTVDVNVNPDNPVINVRSYGESPQMVAELGQLTVAAMQQQGVMSALKHFPGHGDTNVDSHTGLPRVDHDRATIAAVDLLPFAYSINSAAPPAMIMTVHIQYPQLDDSTFVATDGTETILPATMSRKILSGVLREELNYQGVIVTDALDMAGIAHYFDEVDATLQTFRAGADIALMPYTIRNPADIAAFWDFHAQVIAGARDLDATELRASAARIAALKTDYQLSETMDLDARLAITVALPRASNVALEDKLANAAVTTVFGHAALPLQASHWHFVMPDTLRCEAAQQALHQQRPELTSSCTSLARLPGAPEQQWPADSAIIVGDITPHHSLVEMGGMDDLASWRERPSKAEQHAWLQETLSMAREQQLPTVFVALRAPYVIGDFRELATAAVATYDYSAAIADDGRVRSASINALITTLLTGQAAGQLPVSVD